MGGATRMWHRLVVACRRPLVRSAVLNRALPWPLWCALCASDAAAVAWVLARRSGRPLRFLQIGSNDGVIHDPLHEVVRAYRWTGVLVEPLPDLFERLVRNYAGVEGLAFEKAAIAPADGEAVINTVDPEPGDPYWVDQLASFDRRTLLSHAARVPDLEARIRARPVAALTLATLVGRHGLDTVDLLHVDVEGYDYEVLRQIDFDASWAPPFIVYERQHLDRRTDRAARRLLRGAGYRCADIWPDQLAYRRDPANATSSTGGR